jgi:hypothetical protein
MNHVECSRAITDSKIKMSDPRSTSAVFDNPGRMMYRLTRFDGCVVNNQRACDYILEKDDSLIAVELKGGNVDHAVEQIKATLDYLKETHQLPPRRAGLVICTRYPSMDTKIQRLTEQIRKSHAAPLHIKTSGKPLNFDDFFGSRSV